MAPLKIHTGSARRCSATQAYGSATPSGMPRTRKRSLSLGWRMPPQMIAAAANMPG